MLCCAWEKKLHGKRIDHSPRRKYWLRDLIIADISKNAKNYSLLYLLHVRFNLLGLLAVKAAFSRKYQNWNRNPIYPLVNFFLHPPHRPDWPWHTGSDLCRGVVRSCVCISVAIAGVSLNGVFSYISSPVFTPTLVQRIFGANQNSCRCKSRSIIAKKEHFVLVSKFSK